MVSKEMFNKKWKYNQVARGGGGDVKNLLTK